MCSIAAKSHLDHWKSSIWNYQTLLSSETLRVLVLVRLSSCCLYHWSLDFWAKLHASLHCYPVYAYMHFFFSFFAREMISLCSLTWYCVISQEISGKKTILYLWDTCLWVPVSFQITLQWKVVADLLSFIRLPSPKRDLLPQGNWE